MKNIGFEVQRGNRNLIGKLWTIFKVCFVVVFFAWWLGMSLFAAVSIYALGLTAYHGEPVDLADGTISAWWYLGGALLFFYCFTLRPFLRGGAFRR